MRHGRVRHWHRNHDRHAKWTRFVTITISLKRRREIIEEMIAFALGANGLRYWRAEDYGKLICPAVLPNPSFCYDQTRVYPCNTSRLYCVEQTATGGHFGRSRSLHWIVGCNGEGACSSTATSPTAYSGCNSADCPVMSCFPMERLVTSVTE